MLVKWPLALSTGCVFSPTPSGLGSLVEIRYRGLGGLDSVPTLSLLPWGPQLSLLVSLGLSFLIYKMGRERNKLLLGGLRGAENGFLLGIYTLI